ncbi:MULTISPECIES: hypothetical protein [Vibrio]|jgi:hypothetical protein|uniref:hypothetical protein n=1 Tax=Vibrio TaxID=662 RepID=UPI000AD92F6F|nr:MULTISPECIES: hypothetical protein [Vibrio]EGQ9843708.1 hypothetical protein [Vibrio cholerae]EJL6714148.1 hypothetical protein [Vibrio cholerae]MBY7811386.1 hypothetical protein [Vibrio fluvialis]MCG6350552.1 hypothetical protein [Vibrio fluvialis]
MLVKLSTWRKTRFSEGCAPDVRICRREIDLGTLPGKRIGRTYYVDIDREKQSFGDPLLDDLMTH